MLFDDLLDVLVERYGSAKALAAALGVDKSTVTRWINRQSLPNVPHCMALGLLMGKPAIEVVALAYDLEVPAAKTNIQVAIEQDPKLSRETKTYLLAQYELLLHVRMDSDESGPADGVDGT